MDVPSGLAVTRWAKGDSAATWDSGHWMGQREPKRATTNGHPISRGIGRDKVLLGEDMLNSAARLNQQLPV